MVLVSTNHESTMSAAASRSYLRMVQVFLSVISIVSWAEQSLSSDPLGRPAVEPEEEE
jgi:hypothetical protein